MSTRTGATPGTRRSPAQPGAAAAGPAARLERLAVELAERELDALLVDSLVNVSYLTGFTGSSAMAIVRAGPDAGGEGHPHTFLTDFRYTTQAAHEVAGPFAREIVSGELIDAAASLLAEGEGRLGFDDASLTVARHDRLEELLGERWQLVGAGGVVERLRLVKEAGEVDRIRAAARLADEALSGVLEDGLVGRSERELALEIELRMRRLGADAASFPTIVAAGAHAALPHATPRSEPVSRDTLVVIDWGALHDGYCSDCTRTYATGEGVSAQARELYELVLAAQTAGVSASEPGLTGRELDAVARAVIERGGEGERFGHGLGHGVGLEIHEAPRLSRTAPEEPIPAGAVVTIEPGVYIPDVLGVRIEDLVVLAEGGADVLTGLSKEFTVVG